MKKILLSVLSLAFAGAIQTASAQKTKTKDDKKSQQVIIIRDGEKDTKLTIETKDGEVFINGKPASEYKDDNVTVVPGKDGRNSFIYAPGGNMRIFDDNDWAGEKKAFLGVSTEKADKGVKVTNVEKGSAAEKAGLKEGDVITRFGDKRIEDPEDLTEAVTAKKPKDEVNFTYERDGKTSNATAALGETSGWRSFNLTGPDKMNGEWMKEFKNFNKDFNKNFNQNLKDFSYKTPLTLNGSGKTFNYLYRGGKRLGVRVEDTEDESGAKITNVEKESVAEKAGLKNDDIITEIAGKKVKNVSDVIKEMNANAEKNSYNVKAKRNSSEMSFEVKIPKKKNNADL